MVIYEHDNYVKGIKETGLKIKLLEPLEKYPDSIFVEDPAIIYKYNIIILNPADSSRNGEKNIIENEVKHLFDNILFVENGFVEGGDILNINSLNLRKAGDYILLDIWRDGVTFQVSLELKNYDEILY